VVTGSLQASYKGAVRKYGFEGEAGREGEGATRNPESSYRRKRCKQQGQGACVVVRAAKAGRAGLLLRAVDANESHILHIWNLG